MNPLDSQSSSSLHPPRYASAHENLHQKKPSTSSRYLFPTPSPCIIPQENPHYKMVNPTLSYNHLLLPSNSYGPQSMNNYIPPSVNTHYLPHGGYAGLVNQVADGKCESKGQDQECEKEISDEHPKKDDVFKGSCLSVVVSSTRLVIVLVKEHQTITRGRRYPMSTLRKMMFSRDRISSTRLIIGHVKEHQTTARGRRNCQMSILRMMVLLGVHVMFVARRTTRLRIVLRTTKYLMGNLRIMVLLRVHVIVVGEEDHKAKSCPQKKKKISDEQVKNGDHSKNGQDQKALSLLSPDYQRGQQQQFTLPTHGKSLIGTIIHQLCLMRFDGEGSVCEYILEMENLVCRLRDLMMEVSNDFLVHMVLNSLPQVFDTVKLNYYSNTDTWNVNELIAHCVHEEAKHEQNA